MTLLLVLPVVLFTVTSGLEGDPPAGAVSVDGGEVPVVVPGALPGFAKLLAPELNSDGGQTAEGYDAPVIAPQTLSVYKVDLP